MIIVIIIIILIIIITLIIMIDIYKAQYPLIAQSALQYNDMVKTIKKNTQLKQGAPGKNCYKI